MSSIGAPIFVIVPDESDDPVYHPGKILESDAETFIAEFDHLQLLPVGLDVQAYTETDGKFFQQKAVVKQVARINPNPIIAFQRVGPRISAEKRGSYRVHLARVAITGRIGDEKKCFITDISPEGFPAVTGKALSFGSAVPIHLEYDSQILDGLARLQSVCRLPDGKFRCGFLIPERNGRMRRCLERIASSIQRLQLRTTAGFRALDTGVEVSGEIIHALVDGIGSFRETAIRILAKQGIINPEPGEWYSQQAWLDALTIISDKLGPDALYSIGFKVPDNAQFPPDINSLEKALSSLDAIFHSNHRGGLIGHYYFNVVGEKKYEMICENSYPCDFDRGLLTAFCGRFTPTGSESHAVVTHNDSKPCRQKGDNSCTYHITW